MVAFTAIRIIFRFMAGSNHWDFYGRREELGRLLEILRGRRWFFGAIRGRRRNGKTALVQQALTALEQDEGSERNILFFQLPDSDPADVGGLPPGRAGRRTASLRP